MPVCANCVLWFGRTATTCPGCGGIKVLAFYDAQRRPACATCTGNKPYCACEKCGREDSPHGRKCAPCVLEERASELLTDPTGRYPSTAAIQHAAEIPTPILADILGQAPTTTVRWAALAGRDWSQHIAIRGADPAPADTISGWESRP